MGTSVNRLFVFDFGRCIRIVAVLACLMARNLVGTVEQKYEGDACTTSGGERGMCRELFSCTSIKTPPSMDDTCSFQNFTPIVCCQDSTVSDTEARLQEDGLDLQQGSTTGAGNIWLWTDHNDRKQQPKTGNLPSTWRPTTLRQLSPQPPRQPAQNQPSPAKYQQPPAKMQPPPVKNQLPPATNQPPPEKSDTPSAKIQPQPPKNQPPPATNQPPSEKSDTPLAKIQPQPPKNQPPPATNQSAPEQNQVQLPQGGFISAAKCREYSRPVQPLVEALPLLPGVHTIKIPLVRCKFNRLELIVGGTKTLLGEFPHMAALGLQTNDGNEGILWACGGSLISDRFVVTAAHCTFTKRGKLAVVRLGELNLKSNLDGANPVDYFVEEIIRHPEYKATAYYNDIALLRLDRQVVFTENIRPACLYTRNTFKVNKAVATGWGQVGYTEDVSDIMLKVTLDIVPNPTCNQLNQNSVNSKLSQGIVPSMLCAGDIEGGKDTCLGDSGGPLQISNENNQCVHFLVGITSFGQFCGLKGTAGVYSRVSAFVPWIESVVWPYG